MSKLAYYQPFVDVLDDIAIGVRRERQKHDLLNELVAELWGAKLPVGKLRVMTTMVAGRLMADTSLSSDIRAGANRYLGAIFDTLDRVDDPAKHSSVSPADSLGAMVIHDGVGEPEPALDYEGFPLEVVPGVVRTVRLLRTAAHAATEAYNANPTTVASTIIATPEYWGSYRVDNELAVTFASDQQGRRLGTANVTQAEVPPLERIPSND